MQLDAQSICIASDGVDSRVSRVARGVALQQRGGEGVGNAGAGWGWGVEGWVWGMEGGMPWSGKDEGSWVKGEAAIMITVSLQKSIRETLQHIKSPCMPCGSSSAAAPAALSQARPRMSAMRNSSHLSTAKCHHAHIPYTGQHHLYMSMCHIDTAVPVHRLG